MNKDDRVYLREIVARMERIETFIAGGYEVFMQSVLIQDAVMRNFEVIGEATKQISPTLRERYPAINWRGMTGFRDVLIHQYDRLILD